MSWLRAGANGIRAGQLLLKSSLVSLSMALFAVSSARADYLVVAPHPDDDIITSAGVIYRARQNGIVVWVAYMTNGDYYPTGVAWGRTRGDEAVAGQQLLGVPSDHLLFLGYPDGSLQDLHTPAYATTVYTPPLAAQSTMTYARTGSVPYSQFRTGGPVSTTGNNVRADLLYLLEQIAPSDVFVVSTTDMHPDHAATSQFVTEAIVARRTANAAYNPVIHYALVWDSTAKPIVWPLAPDPTTFFTLPPQLASKTDLYSVGYDWSQRESLDVPLIMQSADWSINLKARAIDDHDTQGGFTGLRDDGHISSFVHKDEFFFPRRLAGTVASPDASSRGPVANAGLDQSTSVGASVQLNASGSLPPSGRTLTYAWRQSEGPSVSLSGANSATPSFSVPVSALGVTLAFELRVNDGIATSVADALSVRVSATLPPDAGMPDAGSPDAGMPATDSGVQADSGTQPVDAGAKLDGAADAGANLDAGSDSGAPDAAASDDAAVVDAGVELEAGQASDAGDSTMLDATSSQGGGTTSAWPGDDGFEQGVDDVLDADAGGAVAKPKDGGCAVAITSAARDTHAPEYALFGLLSLFAARRRKRRAALPHAT